MIVGIGVDVVNVAKFGATMNRTPGFTESVFTSHERVDEGGDERSVASLAGRYAAKTALAKALGVPPGMRWHDCEVLVEPDGRPYFRTTAEVAEAAAELGARNLHLSLAMEGDVAVAYVVVEGDSTLAGAQRESPVRSA